MIDLNVVPVKRTLVDAIDAYFTGIFLPQCVGQNINSDFIDKLREDIVKFFRKVVHKASFKTHDDLVVWLSNEYFCAVNINGLRLGQIASTIEPPLDAVPDHDLRRYAEIYRDTDIGDKLTAVLRKRVH